MKIPFIIAAFLFLSSVAFAKADSPQPTDLVIDRCEHHHGDKGSEACPDNTYEHLEEEGCDTNGLNGLSKLSAVGNACGLTVVEVDNTIAGPGGTGASGGN